jgi:hypothetical protein
MGDILLVTVVHSRDELLEEVPCFILREMSGCPYPIKKLPTGCILEDNAQVRAREKYTFEADHIRVSELRVYQNFSLDIFVDLHISRRDRSQIGLSFWCETMKMERVWGLKQTAQG